MDKLSRTIGRIIFAIPFGVFGLLHLFMADAMSGMVPHYVPGGVIWVYLTGLCFIAACIAICANIWVRPAGICLAILLAVFVLTIHVPGLLGPNMGASLTNFLKDFALIGGALMVAGIG